MVYRIDWHPSAIADVRALFDYLAEHASLWDAEYVTEQVLRSTDRLVEFPRLYEADPRYGERGYAASVSLGKTFCMKWTIRRGRIRVLAVVGQRQQPGLMKY